MLQIYQPGKIEYNPTKNEQLKVRYGVCFDDAVALLMQEGTFLGICDHPNKVKYGNQRILVVLMRNYVYLAPFVETKEGIFLKTMFPSRKFTKKYLGR